MPIAFGLIINNIFNLLRNTKDKKSLFLYLLIVQMLVLSFIKLQTSNPPYIIAILAMNMMIKRVKLTCFEIQRGKENG